MAPPKKKGESRSEEEKERRRKNCEVENERNSYNGALRRANEMVEVKLEKERKKYLKFDELSKDVKNCALVKVMDDGKLDFLKGYRMKDKSSFVPLLLNPSHPYVRGIWLALEKYGEELRKEDDDYHKDKMALTNATHHFQKEGWEDASCKRGRAKALVSLLQANDFYYANALWDDEEEWKKAWIEKTMGKWALLYHLRSQQTQERLKRKAQEQGVGVEERNSCHSKRGETSAS